MADMKRILHGALDADNKVSTVYEGVIDLGGGIYAVGSVLLGKALGGNFVPIKVNEDGKLDVAGATIVVTTKDLRGLAANKPDASMVDVGTTYWAIDTDPHADAVEVSDGSNWVVI